MEKYLQAGKIVGTHGVRGELRVQSWCDSPQIFASFDTLYLDSNAKQPLKVKSRVHKNLVLVKMQNIDTLEKAQALKNKIVWVEKNLIPIEDDSYFVDDLIGLEVIDYESGKTYGKLVDVSFTGANDVYHIDYNNKQELIPAIPQVVRQIDLQKGVMKISVMKGLFEDEN